MKNKEFIRIYKNPKQNILEKFLTDFIKIIMYCFVTPLYIEGYVIRGKEIKVFSLQIASFPHLYRTLLINSLCVNS